MWGDVAADKVLQGAFTQPLQTYLDRRQATVEKWKYLRPIFDICVREIGYEGERKLRVPWWRQVAAEKQKKVTVEYILTASRLRRRQESGRCGEIK